MTIEKCKRQKEGVIRSYSGILTFSLFICHFSFALFLPSEPTFAGEFNAVVSIGDVGKSFDGLLDDDGKRRALAEFQDGKLIVLVFTCDHCPIAGSYVERLTALVKDYAPQGVRFVAIDCSPAAESGVATTKQPVKVDKIPIPHLRDAAQQTGHDYGAKVTPQVFVLKPDRKIAYMGAIDDRWDDPAAVEHPYLRDALQTLLSGSGPKPAETRPSGCPIDYE